jgi:hypothetical protein
MNFEELKQANPELGTELEQIMTAWSQQQISTEERDYMINEIRDVRAAQSCAGNEVAFRYVVEACNLLAKVV